MAKSVPTFHYPGLTVIGLTGGMASGKSTIALLFREISGCQLIDADVVCRQLLEPGKSGWQALADRFGNDFFHENQVVDRGLLRRKMFHDAALRREIDDHLHPLVKRAIAARLAVLATSGPTMVLVEVPLLFEAGWEEEFDRIVVVTAGPQECLSRLMRRDKISRAEAEAAMRAQWPLREKERRADVVIDNSGGQSKTRLQLMRLVAHLTEEASAGGRKKS